MPIRKLSNTRLDPENIALSLFLIMPVAFFIMLALLLLSL
jgi:hypothetical protein